MDKRLYSVGGALAVGTLGAWASAERLRRRRREERTLLLTEARHPGGAPLQEEDLAGLPDVVRTWLTKAGVQGRRRVSAARVMQSGSVRGASGGPWRDVRAEGLYTVDPPGFLWQGRVQVGLAGLSVREALLAGAGSNEAHAPAGLPLSQRRGPQLDQAAHLRWLSDTPLMPTVLAGGGPVTWKAVGQGAARASLGAGEGAISGTFLFGHDGLPVAFESERYRPVTGGYQLMPWVVRYLAWGRREGFLVPIRTEASWVLEPGALVHARLEVDAVFYERLPSQATADGA